MRFSPGHTWNYYHIFIYGFSLNTLVLGVNRNARWCSPFYNLRHPRDFKSTTFRRGTLYPGIICTRNRRGFSVWTGTIVKACLNPLQRALERTEWNNICQMLVLIDCRHCCRWKWTLLAHQHADVSWHVRKVVIRTDLAGEAQDSGWTDGPKHGFLPRNGTNDHEQPRSVPFGYIRSNILQLRHALRSCLNSL